MSNLNHDKSKMESDLEAWKSLKLNIGVIGGKSELKTALINKLVGISSHVPDQNQQSNQEETPYSHTNNFNLMVWDLNTSKRDDLNKIELNKYDILLLFRESNQLPTQEDQQLVEEIEKRGKKCLVVSFDSPSKFDLSKLHLDILHALTLLTSDHLASYGLTIEPASKEIVDVKTSILRSRIDKIALLSSMFGHLFQLPRFNILCDAAKLASEIWLYREQLGLSPERIGDLTSQFNHQFTDIINKSKFTSLLVLKDLNTLTSVLIKTLPILILSNDAMDILRILPAAESLLHGTISFASQKLALINILEEFSKISNDFHSLSEKTKAITNPTTNSAIVNKRI